MSPTVNFPTLLQSFFTQRLMQQRQASPHTIGSYRDTFRLLLHFAEARHGKPPSQLAFEQIDAPLIAAFLEDMENGRGIAARSRNLRLTAIRSFFRYAAFEAPAHSEQIQRVLAIPSQRFTRAQVGFLTRLEVEALLAAPDQHTWSGRRDHAILLVAVQSGLRLSELTAIRRDALILGTGAHIQTLGKGRKERATPLTKQTVAVLTAWLREIPDRADATVFPSARGERLSADGVQYLLTKYVAVASKMCPSLQQRRITPHMLRHTTAMELLQAGMDRAVIALWLGHESVETTQIYLDANLAIMLRHTTAMELLQAGIDRAVIALWLGHESVETTQIYLDANLAMKEQALAKTAPPEGKPGRFRPDDRLLAFLKGL